MLRDEQTVWVIGAGAVGSAIAAILSEHTRVVLVGDSPHARQVMKKGLKIALYNEEEQIKELEVKTSSQVKSMGANDLLLLTGKIPSLGKTAEWLKEVIHPGQWIAAMQNGMGFEDELEANLGMPIQRGIIQFGANSSGSGDVRYYRGKLIFPPSEQAQLIQKWMTGSPISCEITEDFRKAQWNKLMINAVANPLAGLLRINNRMIGDPDLNDVKKNLLKEVKEVAATAGIAIHTTMDELNAYFKSENVPSLVRDLERGLPTEIEYINGYIVREGKHHGIATPVNAALTAMIIFLSGQKNDGKEV